MPIIARLQLPKTLETSNLYINFGGDVFKDYNPTNPLVTLHQGEILSFNSYFNSIYEHFYTKYTNINQLEYLLQLEGEFEISVYRERYGVVEKELVNRTKVTNQVLSNYVNFPLSQLGSGRIYLEITCLSEKGIVGEGLLVTQQAKQRDVSLAIITCTFKKEAYVKKTVDLISQDERLQDKKFQIFVVDNGQTLNHSDFEDSRVKLISNPNVGGSGGFTKGLIEALQEDSYTHFLLMDDDIELDSEVIYRLFPLYEYGKQDLAIAGSMLDFYQKHILYEAGALYNKRRNNTGNIEDSEFHVAPLKQDTDLSNASNLNLLLNEEEVDYGAFWFFAFSKEVVNNIGLPLPFFIKIDDIEFGVRVKKYLNNAIVPFPSIAVWHEPFYLKHPIWDTYYTSRNMLAANAIHGSLAYWSALKNISGAVIYHLLLFNYNTAQMYVKAFEDFLKGPNFIKSSNSEILHREICGLSKSHKTQKFINPNINVDDNYQITKVGKLKKIISLLTLNGHLLPKFMIRDEEVFINYPEDATKRDSICKAFPRKRLILKYYRLPALYHNEIDNQAAFNILSIWVKSVIKSIFGWSKINQQWQTSAQELTSINFWRNYLESHQN